MTEALLPPNTTDLERALDMVLARAEGVTFPHATLWNPATCPVAFLPWLAWALSVDSWSSDWDEARRREVIQNALPDHRRRGTRGSVRRALEAAGFPADDLVEGRAILRRDGTHFHEGAVRHGSVGYWAIYDLIYQLGVAGVSWTAAQLALLQGVAAGSAPERDQLGAVRYPVADSDDVGVADAAPEFTLTVHYRHDATWAHDGRLDRTGSTSSLGAWA